MHLKKTTNFLQLSSALWRMLCNRLKILINKSIVAAVRRFNGNKRESKSSVLRKQNGNERGVDSKT